MSPHQSDRFGLLGWYPPGWRERYGEEFGALMEDSLDGQPPPLRFRLSIMRSGLCERGHEAGVIGNTSTAACRARAGSLLVLCAWAAFMVAGASFANLADGFRQALPARSQTLPTAAYGTVVVVAILGALSVISGILIALPAFLRFLRAGGWLSIRGHVLRAAMATIAAAVAVIALKAVAVTLTPAQRNGELVSHPVVSYYLVGFIATVLVLAVMLALWTVAAVVAVGRMDLPRSVLSAEAVLARAVAVAMLVVTAATAVWWGATAAAVPWFFNGTSAGSTGSVFGTRIVGTMVLMLVACIVAAFGVGRTAHVSHRVRSS